LTVSGERKPYYLIVLLVLLFLFVLVLQTNPTNQTYTTNGRQKNLLDRINLIIRIKERIASKPHVGSLWGWK
jgi:hypothetical protein